MNHNYNISFYKLNCSKISPSLSKIDKTVGKYSNQIQQCQKYEWINDSPSLIKNRTDFYTEYLQFDDYLPNMMFFRKNISVDKYDLD